jgi:hypothetical protein
MKLETFEVANNIRRIILNRAAESMHYLNWSNNFVASEIREIPTLIQSASWYSPINLSDLTEKEMISLGFQKWSNDNPMYLIPLWLFPFLPEEIDCGTLNNIKQILKKSEMSDDNRGGCLAYGIYPKK